LTISSTILSNYIEIKYAPKHDIGVSLTSQASKIDQQIWAIMTKSKWIVSNAIKSVSLSIADNLSMVDPSASAIVFYRKVQSCDSIIYIQIQVIVLWPDPYEKNREGYDDSVVGLVDVCIDFRDVVCAN